MTSQKQYECRFCLQTDERQNLIAPCFCKGSYKYVHSKCLLEWYKHAPSKGDRCNVCSFIYKQGPSPLFEDWPTTNLIVSLHLFYPFPMILISHWFYFTLLSYAHVRSDANVYVIYQLGWHLAMSFEFLSAVYRIQNRRAYALEWRRLPRPILPLIHSYLLLILGKTGCIGGVASNICMVYYFYEHRKIIDTLNTNPQRVFLSRRLSTRQ